MSSLLFQVIATWLSIKKALTCYIGICLHTQVFCAVWEASPGDRATLQRVLGTWDRIFPPQALDAIHRRAGLASTLASAPVAAPQQLPAHTQQPLAQQPPPPQQPSLGPVQRNPALLEQPPQPLPKAFAQQQQQDAQQGQSMLRPDQLRAAAAARLAALRAPQGFQQQPPPPQRRPQQPQRHGPGLQNGGQPVAGPAALQDGRRVASSGSREYEPTMPAPVGGAAMAPEQLSQLEALLRSLAQGLGPSAATPAPSVPSRTPDELWSTAVLKVRACLA